MKRRTKKQTFPINIMATVHKCVYTLRHAALCASVRAVAIGSKSMRKCGKVWGGVFHVILDTTFFVVATKALQEHESSTLSSSVCVAVT